MKKVLKQPALWVACVCFLAAMVLAIVGSVRDTTPAVVAKMENAFNKKDSKKMISCMTPEAQKLLEGLGAEQVMNYFSSEAGTMYVLVGAVEEEPGNPDREKALSYVVYYDKSGKHMRTDSNGIGLITIDGKQYME